MGPVLQRRLQQRQEDNRNWLEDWWLHSAYLGHRHPLLPTLNTTGPHPLNLTLWQPCVQRAFEYGSLYLWAFLHFHQALREERFRPHTTRELEDWWLHSAYLGHRHPLLPTLNTTGPHPLNLTLWQPCVQRAFEYGSLYRGPSALPPTLREERSGPTYQGEEEGDCPMHVTVLCKGHIWILYPWDAQGSYILLLFSISMFSLY
ncbi:Peroxisomal carnitine O-octanoyltransferase [Chionoecetes opilio]|uniref:Peroxisomal carnitine O-octanoyltransferase n=1 Tax=Chionoecetes opilio TaxID=41210 RepID=A0A8J5CNQ1_CHIOP|nr:Peroxisomal carnitine O-octanoyltransferase [Chionoecetes opilio]